MLKLLLASYSPPQPCRFDTDIQRDLPRTFPAHDFFRDKRGQEILYQLTRCYSLYDEEVGYTQGISFIAAALLLHVSYLLTRTCGGIHLRGRLSGPARARSPSCAAEVYEYMFNSLAPVFTMLKTLNRPN